MESFGLSYNDILYKYDWLTLSLLMLDKMRYVGTKTDKETGKKAEKVKVIKDMTEKEEADFFSSLK